MTSNYDLADVLGSAAFAGPRDGASAPTDLPPAVAVGDVTFRGSGAYADHHACDDRQRVPAGAGFWSGDSHEDLCTWCYEVAREEPHRAPTPDEEILLARHGIGRGGFPTFVAIRDDPGGTIDRLAVLVTDGQVPRIALERGSPLRDWLESGGVLPDGAVVRREGIGMQFGTISLRQLELQLRGELCGPPIDPDLMARLEAAKDDRGVVRDADLANEYHMALIAQDEAARVLRGDPEPIIEQGRVFPTTPECEPPLG